MKYYDSEIISEEVRTSGGAPRHTAVSCYLTAKAEFILIRMKTMRIILSSRVQKQLLQVDQTQTNDYIVIIV